jgi:cytochrome c-type biogenesis protein CcmH/NrfF
MLNMVLAEGFFDKTLWEGGWLYVWQLPAIALLIGIIIFWMIYRRKQM